MPLSSNSIFHFTNSRDKLLGILENLFIPYYSLESLEINSQRVRLSIPMVCFCDIPLSQIKEHIGVYGNYGIGMIRQWAIERKLNPVFYLESKSILATSIDNIQDKIISAYQKKDYKLSIREKDEFYILRYIKNYQGNFVYRGKVIKRDYKYYDEKEWRYVPKNLTSYYNIINESFNNKMNNETDFSNYKLSFNPDDIRYLIVKDDSDIVDIIDKLKLIKSKFSQAKIEKLISKVITINQIFEDF